MGILFLYIKKIIFKVVIIYFILTHSGKYYLSLNWMLSENYGYFSVCIWFIIITFLKWCALETAARSRTLVQPACLMFAIFFCLNKQQMCQFLVSNLILIKNQHNVSKMPITNFSFNLGFSKENYTFLIFPWDFIQFLSWGQWDLFLNGWFFSSYAIWSITI